MQSNIQINAYLVKQTGEWNTISAKEDNQTSYFTF